MSAMKHNLLFIIFFTLTSAYGQIMDGQRGNSQSAVKQPAPSDLSADASQHNVNLFNGTFNTSYDLGSVKTLEGLSFSLSLDYASTFTGGDNVPITSGIPYGEGWNLSIPSITIDNYSFHNYSEQELLQFDQQLTNGSFNRKNMTRQQLMKEGQLYWFSPFINIPGVISERFVFKYFDNAENRSVFVPHTFDNYVEARFDGQYWEVKNSNGNNYRFDVIQVATNNSSNERIHNTDPEIPYDMDLMYNLVVPKSQIVGWYCSEISNPTHTAGQKIYFEYEKFGDYNYFQEYYDPRTAALIGDHFMGPFKICVPWTCKCLETPSSLMNFTAYKDIYLKRVLAASYSTVLQELELNYRSVDIRALGAVNVLQPGDAGVMRKDSLYNYKAVYTSGIGTNWVSPQMTESVFTGAPVSDSYGSSFSGWNRYLHIKANGAWNINDSENQFGSGMDPYKAFSSSGNYYCKAASLNVTNGDLPFGYGFLESPRINMNEIVAGDQYEVRALIRHDAVGTEPGAGFCNFDVNVVSGNDKLTTQFLNGLTQNKPIAATIDDNKRYEVFSTFNQPVKWNTRSSLNTTHPGYILMSNTFTMPNLPFEYDGVQVQVGPANSDHDFSKDPSSIAAMLADNSTFIPAAAMAYYGYLLSWGANQLHPTSPIPHNFGMGLPWQMMERFYADYDDGNFDFYAVRNRHWWSGGTENVQWSNEPTLAGNNVFLAGFAFVRHSKNAYMLSSVVKYETNGEISPFYSSGRIPVSQINMEYEVQTDTLLNNVISNLMIPQQRYHGYHNTVLLKQIINVPVNQYANPTASAYAREALPRTRYKYEQLRRADYSENRDNKFLYPMSEIVNRLGGRTIIEYYDFMPGSFHTANIRVTRWPKDILSGNTVLESHIAVKKIKEEKGDNLFAEWDYSYQDRIVQKRSPQNPHIKKHFHLTLTDSRVGYKTVTVTEPSSSGGNDRNYFVHNYYDGNDPVTFGKLRSTDYYNSSHQLLKSTELQYDNKLAFKNGAHRSNYIHEHTDDDYGTVTWGINYAASINYPGFFSVPVMVGQETIRFLEADDAAAFDEFYLNSYFTPLKRKIETEYDYPETTSLYDVLNTSLSSGTIEAFNNPTDAMSDNTNPVERVGLCSITPAPVMLSIITDYNYWDADYTGKTSSPGYKLLIPEFNGSDFQLHFEPSWKLFSERTFSPGMPGAFNKTEYYYYYDLKNFDEAFVRTSFAPVYHSHIHKIRDLVYETRKVTSVSGIDSASVSTYTMYSTRWNNNLSDVQPMVTIPYAGPLLCPSDDNGSGTGTGTGSGSGTSVIVPADCIRAFNASAPPPPGFQLKYYNTIAFYCPLGAEDGSTPSAGQRVIIYNQEPGIPNVGYWVAGKLKYSSTVLQAGENEKTGYLSITRKPKDGILTFKEVQLNNSFLTIPEYPYDTLKMDSVIERTEFGQVKLIEDEKGLRTRYFYTYPVLWYYRDYNNPCNSYTAVYWENLSGPVSMIRGYDLPNQQQEDYEYNLDNSIKSIRSINNQKLSYTYDAFGRVHQEIVNDKLYKQYGYSLFHNDEVTGYRNRTTQNYIDKWHVQTPDSILHERTYFDPSGRTQQTLSQTVNSLVSGSPHMLYSGEIIYDLKDRMTKEYDGFYFSNPSHPVHFTPKYNSTDISLPQVFSEVKYDDLVINNGPVKTAGLGINIQTGHINTLRISLITGAEFFNELTLSQPERNMVLPSGSGSIVRKEIVRDPDGKRAITYKSALGHLLAEKRYSDNLKPVSTLYKYDESGNNIKILNPLRQHIIYQYNKLGWRFSEFNIDKGQTNTMFNRSGQPVMIQDQNGRSGVENNEVKYARMLAYDNFGRPTKQSKVSIPGFNPVQYESDPVYNYDFKTEHSCSWIFKLFVPAPGGSIEKKYDDFIDNETVEKEYNYDYPVDLTNPAAQNISAAIQQRLLQMQRNLHGRMSWSCSYDNGIPQYMNFFSYDTTGNVLNHIHQFDVDGIAGGSSTLSIEVQNTEIDRYGHVLSSSLDTDMDGNSDVSFGYKYDARGRFRKTSFSGGVEAEYSYDEANQSLSNTRYYYHVDKTCGSQQVDNITYSYDVRDNLLQINSRFYSEDLRYEGNTLNIFNNLPRVKHGYNYNGNINSIRHTYKGAAIVNPAFLSPTDYGYRYDQLDRLIAADGLIYDGLSVPVPAAKLRYGDETYTYDKVGNIETLNRYLFYPSIIFNPENKSNQWRYVYFQGTNKLEAIDSASLALRMYTYDPNGNMLTDSKRGLIMSQFNGANLPKVINTGSGVAEYGYNIGDLRIYKKDVSVGVEEFCLRDISGKEVALYDYVSGTWKYFLNGLGRVGEIGDEVKFFEYDHLGNTRVSYSVSPDCGGNGVVYTIKGVYDYFPSGKILRSYVSGDRDKFLTTGNERDNETGLDYRNARFSDPEIGVFRSVDPLAHLMLGWSPYATMLCNPILYVDPDGKIPWPVMKKWVTSTGNTIVRRIDSEFGMRTLNGRTHQHRGLDMNLGAGRQDLGVPIYATHDGIVKINRDKSDKNDAGNRVHIESADGTLKTVYMHMKDPSSFAVGAEVKEGDIIGYIGGTAKGQDNKVDASGKRITGTDVHLHYELHQKNAKGEFVATNPLNQDGTLKDPQKMLGLPSNEKLSHDLKDNSTNIQPKNK